MRIKINLVTKVKDKNFFVLSQNFGPEFSFALVCSGVTMTAKTSLNVLKGQESEPPGGKCKGKLWAMLG